MFGFSKEERAEKARKAEEAARRQEILEKQLEVIVKLEDYLSRSSANMRQVLFDMIELEKECPFPAGCSDATRLSWSKAAFAEGIAKIDRAASLLQFIKRTRGLE